MHGVKKAGLAYGRTPVRHGLTINASCMLSAPSAACARPMAGSICAWLCTTPVRRRSPLWLTTSAPGCSGAGQRRDRPRQFADSGIGTNAPMFVWIASFGLHRQGMTAGTLDGLLRVGTNHCDALGKIRGSTYRYDFDDNSAARHALGLPG